MKASIYFLSAIGCAYGAVSCGGHSAATCELCPQGNGAAWCNGDCRWENNTCTLPSIACTPTIFRSKCDDCAGPRHDMSETGCEGGDCVWNPSTQLCREFLTNAIRTASVHLYYDPPVSRPTWWFQRLEVAATSTVSYFASNGHGLGYGGLQQVSENPFVGKVLFSLWDQGCDQDVQFNCDSGTLAQVIACGKGVTCEGFGGEGTGKKSWFYFNTWMKDEPYYMVTHARDMNNGRVRYSGYFKTDTEWRFLATFEVNAGSSERWWLHGLYSFVEQWSPQNTDQTRAALYGPGFMLAETEAADVGMSGACPAFTQIQSAQYSHGTRENHMHVNAWAEEGKVGIVTGGDAVSSTRFLPKTPRNERFVYPDAEEPAALIEFKSRMSCLETSGEDNREEIASCLTGPPQYSCSASQTKPSPSPPPPSPSPPPPSPSPPPSSALPPSDEIGKWVLVAPQTFCSNTIKIHKHRLLVAKCQASVLQDSRCAKALSFVSTWKKTKCVCLKKGEECNEKKRKKYDLWEYKVDCDAICVTRRRTSSERNLLFGSLPLKHLNRTEFAGQNTETEGWDQCSCS